MNIVSRKREQDILALALSSGRPEFVALYGRRRVGKTFLVKEFFHNRFAFYATGVQGLKTRDQLRVFNEALVEYGSMEKTVPKDWIEAFSRIRKLLESGTPARDPVSGRLVIFLDEIPWMDTARSDFKSALDYFWNSWASSRAEIMLIVCGSATSWIIKNIVRSTGGFYNRLTRQISLRPFTLFECEQLCIANGMPLSRTQLMGSYMVFGGIPYYLNALDRRLSLAQNIEELCFNENGELHYEYDRLFRSLFKNAEKHIAVINALAARQSGMTRGEIAGVKGIGNGEILTNTLSELVQCGFVRKYHNFLTAKNGCFYQIIDPFVLFGLQVLQNPGIRSWMNFYNTPAYYSWCGRAFEMVCLNHISQIKKALGISGIETSECSWRSRESAPGAQIDLLIDRSDGVINVCEMKYSAGEYVIDASCERNLLNKMEVFRKEAGTKKQLYLTMVTAGGLAHNSHYGVVINEITGEDLFA